MNVHGSQGAVSDFLFSPGSQGTRIHYLRQVEGAEEVGQGMGQETPAGPQVGESLEGSKEPNPRNPTPTEVCGLPKLAVGQETPGPLEGINPEGEGHQPPTPRGKSKSLLWYDYPVAAQPVCPPILQFTQKRLFGKLSFRCTL